MSKGLWQRGIELRERTQAVLGTSSTLIRKYNKWYAKREDIYLGSSIGAAMAKLDRLAKEGRNGKES